MNNLLYTIGLCLIMTIPIFAQEIQNDSTQRVNLDQIIIGATKSREILRHVPSSVSLIGASQIKFQQSQTTADLLQNNGSIFVQKSQQGGGSPVLRGFEANKVLLVIDGIRMNNAIYRGGHLQNVITMDNFSLAKVEILQGASSIVYGSDALGGVIHFYTKNPQFSTDDKLSIYKNVAIRYGSVNQEKTIHADLNLGGKKFASFTSITASSFGDLKMGKRVNPALGSPFGLREYYVDRINDKDSLIKNTDPYLQVGTAYDQLDIVQKFSHKINENWTQGLNLQLSTSTDVPRYDRLTDKSSTTVLNQAQWYYGPQKRLLVAYELSNGNPSEKWAQKMVISYQKIEESRHNRRFNAPRLSSRIENLGVLGLNYDISKQIGSNVIRFGIDGQYNDLKSTAFNTVLKTNAKESLSTRYPDGANNFSTISAYFTHSRAMSEKLTLTDGLRLGFAQLSSKFIDKTFFPFPFDEINQKNLVYSASVGLAYNPTNKSKIGLSLASGYRVPNIDDLAKVFESTKETLIVPNPDLKPEKTIGVDLNGSISISQAIQVDGALFYTLLQDAIVVSPYTFNGKTTIDYNGGTAKVVASQNNAKANIRGFQFGINADLSSSFSLQGNVQVTKGKITLPTAIPLDHVPPMISRVSLDYHQNKIRASLYTIINGWKRIADYNPNGEDNQQYAPEAGMPSWYTINMRLGYQLTKNFDVMAGVENILDQQYRTFSSGINGAGRNINFSVIFH